MYQTKDITLAICEHLKVRRATHPLDGGTHVSRMLAAESLAEAVDEIKAANPKAILELIQYKVFEPSRYEEVERYKVRGIFDESI